MARGIFPVYARITTNADTELFAAPGARERINIRWITVDVESSGTGSLLRVEVGVGGNIVTTLDTADDNNRLERVYHIMAPSKGYALALNTALNAETTGSGAATIVVNGEVEVS